MQEYTYNIKGDFSSVRALEIKEELRGLTKTCANLIIDATCVIKSDRGSINALMMCHKRMIANRGKMTLKLVPSQKSGLNELLDVTKFSRILNIQYV